MKEVKLTPKTMIDRVVFAVTLSAAQGAEAEYGRFHKSTQSLKRKYTEVQ